MTYFSTFISGLGEIVSGALKKHLQECKIELLLDGLVVYRSNPVLQRIIELRFFNNSFALLEMVKEQDSEKAMQGLVNKVLGTNVAHQAIKPLLHTNKRMSFRLMFSKENQPISIGPKILRDLEKEFASNDLFVNRINPGAEFLFLTRKDGYGFLGLRLTRHRDYKKTLHAGELRPELANLLCFFSDPKPHDIFLDPFSGYGAIPMERAVAFPYKQIYAGDIDSSLVTELKRKAARFGSRFIISTLNATNLKNFKDSSIDKIVTDPPWGIYSNGENFDKLYLEFLTDLVRVLKGDGILVILTANTILMNVCLPKIPDLKLQKMYNILVSGKKAAIYKMRKVTRES